MTTQEQHPTNEPVENGEILAAILNIQRGNDEILRKIGNIRQEQIGFKRLVLTQLVDIKERLTTPTDVLLPQTHRETTPTGTGDTVMALTTGEDSPSARVPAAASLPAESARHDHAVHHQPVSPADQETSEDPAEGAQQR